MQTHDHRDPNYWILRQRTLEWAEHQLVSLLDVDGIGKGTIRALRKVGIEIASQLMKADAEDLITRLAPYNIPPCKKRDKAVAIVKDWQERIRKHWIEREEELKRARTEDANRY